LVEAGDVYLGGERNQGKGAAGNAHVTVACECECEPGGRMRHVAMHLVSGFSKPQMRIFPDAYSPRGPRSTPSAAPSQPLLPSHEQPPTHNGTTRR
jgi:hypothetical protein